jgi:hypothetical protein
MLDAISEAAHKLYEWLKEKISSAWHRVTS